MSFVAGVLANRADETFRLAIGVNADEVEHLALVKIAFVALEISHSKLLYLIRLDVHQLIIKDLTDIIRSSAYSTSAKIHPNLFGNVDKLDSDI